MLLVATLRRYAKVFPRVAVVIRETDDDLAQALGVDCPGVRIVRAADAELGMGHSLAAGIRAVAGDWSWVAVALGDMPWVRAETLHGLLRAFRARDCAGIVQPCLRGRVGHPVLFGASCFVELSELSGDTGARSVLERHRSEVVRLEVDDPGILEDLDRPG